MDPFVCGSDFRRVRREQIEARESVAADKAAAREVRQANAAANAKRKADAQAAAAARRAKRAASEAAQQAIGQENDGQQRRKPNSRRQPLAERN